jgi:hypothetical protein
MPRDWQSLSTSDQLSDLLALFGNFHDACIRELHVVTGHYVDEALSMHVDWRTTIRMLIQRQFAAPSAIELRFEEVVEMRICPPPPDFVAIIFGAAFFLENGIFYWSDNSAWRPLAPGDGESTWVAARKLFWRDASDWLGPRLRYREDPTSQ